MTDAAKPFLAGDVGLLRRKLAGAEGPLANLWSCVKRLAAADPLKYPWFPAFCHLATGEEVYARGARECLLKLCNEMPASNYNMGIQFHYWCAAFPAARQAIMYDWVADSPVFSDDDRRFIESSFIRHVFVNFYTGLRVKPTLETGASDNQILSCAFTCLVVGYLFGVKRARHPLARVMYEESLPWFEPLIGNMPASGYSLEGSTYMDVVVGPAVALTCAALEEMTGQDWFERRLPPNGASMRSMIEMISRIWMPCGLYLPWDNHGYHEPAKMNLAFLACRSGDAACVRPIAALDCWAVNPCVGWGWDDTIWTLLWWPDGPAPAGGRVFPTWAHDEVGGALVSPDGSLYLMQMWDTSGVNDSVGRPHVNPNSLVIDCFGSPITVDGNAMENCAALNFEDCWQDRQGMDFFVRRFNFGAGTLGAHNCIIVDGWEGLRPMQRPLRGSLVAFTPGRAITGDVTPFYAEHYDARSVRRTSRLVDDRFFVVSDAVDFASEHTLASRWYFRPLVSSAGESIAVETAEGVRLTVIPLDDCETAIRPVEGFPSTLEKQCVQVDFIRRMSSGTFSLVLWPDKLYEAAADVTDGWEFVPDDGESLDAAAAATRAPAMTLPIDGPPQQYGDVPVAAFGWYRRKLDMAGGAAIRLPRGFHKARLWLDGDPLELPGAVESLPPVLKLCGTARVAQLLIKVPLPSHGAYAESFYGKASLLRRVSPESPKVVRAGRKITVSAAGATHEVEF